MSRSKEEIEKLQKNEEKKENENSPKIKAPIMNAFKKMVTEKITIQSDDDEDEKNEEKLNIKNKEIKESNNEDNKKEINEVNTKDAKNEKKEDKIENKEQKNEKDNDKKNEEIKPKFSLFNNQSTSNTQSLFGTIGNSNNNNSNSLFGNINNNNNSTSLFGNINNNKNTNIFSNNFASNKDDNTKKEGNLFSGESLFKPSGSLFSNTEGLTFSGFKNTTSFFTDNISKEKKNENELEEEDENELFKDEDDKPKTENPKPLESQDISNYEKKFTIHIDNFYVYSKENKKYISKGNGFLSIEISKDKNKKSSVIVFRNHGGNKLVEGFIINNLSKIITEEKNYKNISTVHYLSINNLGKNEIGIAKIPFSNIELFKSFKNAFEEGIKYVKG